MSKKYGLIVASLLIGGLAAGVLLFPRDREIAQMQVKDKLFAQAQAIYEKALTEGDLDIRVVGQVSDLYVQGGAIDKAIAVMEQFVALHPHHIEARERLGAYYQSAQRTGDYLLNLEEINRLSPDPERMKQLADLYQFNTEYAKQAVALKKIIADPNAREARHYTDLSALQASNKEYAAAAATLRQMKRDMPGAFGADALTRLMTLLYDQNAPAEALAEAKIFLESQRDPKIGAEVVALIHSRGAPTDAETILALFSSEQIDAEPGLLEESIALQIAGGEEDAAYARLAALHPDRLTPSLAGEWLLLASARADHETTRALIPRAALAAMSESRLARLTQAAVANNDTHLLAALIATFPPAHYGETHPLLSAMLAVVRADSGADDRIAALAAAPLTAEQQLQMAHVCVVYNKFGCAGTFLNRLPPQQELGDGQIVQVGELYLQMRQWDRGSAYIREALTTRDSDPLRFIAAKYAAAAGDESDLAEWLLARGESVKPGMLRDVYFTAMNTGHYPAALLVAKTMHERGANETTRRDLAQTYLKLAQYGEAVVLLRPVKGAALLREDEDAYLYALSRDARFRAELVSYAGDRLKSDITNDRRKPLIYALVNAKRSDVALPYIRDLATQEGGAWASLYAETLDKQGKHEEARAFWLRVATSSSTPAKEKTAIAYHLLDRGYRADAESIFAKLAEQSGPDSQAVAALLYVWGEKPTAKQLDFLLARYAQADRPADRSAWAALIAPHANEEVLPQWLKRHPELIYQQPILETYLQILVRENRFAGTDSDFIQHAKERGNGDLLRVFARTARANSFEGEARRAYSVLAEMIPADNSLLREAGLAAYGQADYTASEAYLTRYLSAKEAVAMDAEAYRAQYYYAELLRRNKKPDAAREHYEAANRALNAINDRTAEQWSLLAQSRIGLGEIEQGIATYEQAVQAYPSDAQLSADYLAALIDKQRYDEARAFLARRDEAPIKPMLGSVSPAAGAPSAREVKQNRLRYELLQARMDVETGRLHAAATRMDDLMADYPNDPQVMGFAANVENYAGNWPQALQLLKSAQEIAPENEDIAALQQSIRRAHGPELRFDADWISRGKNNEIITRFSGLADISSQVQIGASLASNHAKAKNVRRADGRVGTFNGDRRQGEIFARYHSQPGWMGQFSIFGNDDTGGFGGYFQFVNPLGTSLLTAEWRRPYWEYTEAVLDDATRDRAALSHTIKPTTKLTVQAGGGVNRYHVENARDVLSAASAELDVVYRLFDEQPYLAIGYGLDGEYTLDQKKSFDATGAYTSLFPMRSREIHSLSLMGGWTFGPHTYADGLVGYGLDRLGGSGPLAEARITHEFTPSLDGQLRAYYGIDTSETDNHLSRLGGYVRWRF